MQSSIVLFVGMIRYKSSTELGITKLQRRKQIMECTHIHPHSFILIPRCLKSSKGQTNEVLFGNETPHTTSSQILILLKPFEFVA